jgi:two-component sensor histidine kinase
MMKRSFFIRFILLLILWIPVSVWSIRYGLKERSSLRLDFLILSNGTVSVLQQENWNDLAQGVLPNDRVVKVSGQPFSFKGIKEWMRTKASRGSIELSVIRNKKESIAYAYLKPYSKNSYLTLFWIPLLLSGIFLLFSLGVALHRAAFRKAREAMEVFSALCFLISLFFLTFLPTVTLGTAFSFSVWMPLLGIMVVHLFSVYPKKKGASWARISLLSFGYLAAFVLGFARIKLWNSDGAAHWIHDLNTPTFGICSLIALGAIGNTLLTSKDFWARRRARLMSLVFGFSFLVGLSVFMAFVWEIPRLSWERILAVSLFFPTAFAVVFLKSNVFNLERIFRRSLHQLLLLVMAITFAVLVGVGWSQWQIAPQEDWMLWVAIAIVVVALARPVGNAIENGVHRLIQTRVRYPKVNELFENSKSLEPFLRALSHHLESDLKMELVTVRCFQDPTAPWKDQNEQCFRYQNGELVRLFEKPQAQSFSFTMTRGDMAIGEICFDGGDALAFDPNASKEWVDCIRSTARCVELLALRDFLSIQQGFLAVARMQSLLAHEMKNPLAIIKVCSGLLSSHVHGIEEAEELLRTIQGEVRRVASGIQKIFDSSGRADQREKVNLSLIIAQVKESALSRFPDRKIETSYKKNGEEQSSKEGFLWIWVDREGFKQSLLNLVINAFEAESRQVKIEVDWTLSGLSLSVADDGIGLPEKIDLYKPFVTTKPNGTGLGLAHVKSFVDKSQGQIRVQSKRGEGTNFVLEFSKTFVMNEG